MLNKQTETRMIDPESAISNALPRLKSDVRIAPFHDGAAAGERYLVEVGEVCFVAGKSMRDVLLALADKPATLEALAATYEQQTGQAISVEVLADLLTKRIPDSLFDHTPAPKNKRPFIFSFDLIPERFIRPFSEAFAVLFAKPIVLFVCIAFVLAEFLVFSRSVSAIQHPFRFSDLVIFYFATIAVTLFHELGHAAACRRFQCPHGDIGFALYLIYPAFYTDVTKVWRLPRLQRAVVDLGGVYFQAILFIALTLYVMLTHDLLALRLLWAMNFMMLLTLNPIFKMDGYWLLTDLSGLSNLHQQVRDACVRIARKLFRRPLSETGAPQAQGLRLKMLYAYTALAAVYYAFIIQFLYLSGDYLVKHFPSRARYLAGLSETAYFAGEIERALYFAMTLVRESVWPLILCVAIVFLVYRGLGFLFRMISASFAGYTLTISMPRWAYGIEDTISSWKARWAKHG